MFTRKIRKIFASILLVGIFAFWSAPLWAAPAYYNGQPVEVETSYDQNFASTQSISFPLFTSMVYSTAGDPTPGGDSTMICNLQTGANLSFASLATDDDPYYTFQDTTDGMVLAGLASTVGGSPPNFGRHWCWARTKISFDTRAIPDNAIITNAYIVTTGNGVTFNDWYLEKLSLVAIKDINGDQFEADEGKLQHWSFGEIASNGSLFFQEVGERLPFWFATSTLSTFGGVNNYALLHTPDSYNWHSGGQLSDGSYDGSQNKIRFKQEGLSSINKSGWTNLGLVSSDEIDRHEPLSRPGMNDISEIWGYTKTDEDNGIAGMQLVVQYTYNQIPLPGVDNATVAIEGAVFIFFLLLVDLARRFYQDI